MERGRTIFADKHTGWGRTDWRGDAQVTKTNTHNFGTFGALYIDGRLIAGGWYGWHLFWLFRWQLETAGILPKQLAIVFLGD